MEYCLLVSTQNIPSILAEVAHLYADGKYLTALETLRQIDDATLRQAPEALIAAGQVAGMTGGNRLRLACYRRAWQMAPQSSNALYYYTRSVLMRRGLFTALETIERFGTGLDLETPLWLSLRAYLLSELRDFRNAFPLMERALTEQPDDPWLYVEHAYQLETADDYDASFAAVERALSLHPWYRAAVQHKAKLLSLRGEDDAAYGLLHEAAGKLESEAVVGQLYAMQMERGHYNDARASLQRIEILTPLKDKHYRTWLAAAQGEVAYALGDHESAIRFSREAGTPFQRNLADAIERHHGQAPRRLLDVTFVRQHHNTCGPATMSALTRYFGAAHDHSSLVEAIWYNGTTAYDERRWGNENGWHVREFTADWESTVALIDRGIPFALSTQEADSAHLQAVIGYDANRDFILVRDPYHRSNQEFAAGPFFERYRSTGPRGMIFVPANQKELLEGIALPDANAYDLVFDLQDALRHHDRQRAGAALTRLSEIAPGSRLSLHAERTLAYYDRNDLAAISAIRALQQLYPDDLGLQIAELDALERLGEMATYIGTLHRRGSPPNAAAQLQIRYAAFHSNDARCHQETLQRLKHLLRRRSYQADAYAALAELEWSARNRHEATRFYRVAANLQIDSEQYALDYFRAARFLRQTEEALAWLRDRMKRYENHSSQPVIAYYRALSLLSREHEGIELLEAALKRRPDDGDLLLFTAESLRDNGRFDDAERHLQRAKGIVAQARWLTAHAKLLNARHRREEALAAWREVAAIEPLNISAHRQIADLLSTLEGRDAAARYCDELLNRYPQIQPILELRADWFDRDAPADSLQVLRRITELNPGNAWAWREQAILLNRLEEFPAAIEALGHAEQLEPASVPLYQIKGDLLLDMGQVEQARECYREAIKLSVDSDYAIDHLLQHSYTTEQKREALAFIRDELARQVVHGDGLWSYQSWASGILEPEELLAELRHAHEVRPDLWYSSSALSRQLLEMGRTAEALDIAESAAERFPLLPRVWLDLARCRRLNDDASGEAEALQRAMEINPDWVLPILRLSEHHERLGDYQRSRDVLRDYLQRDDSDSRVHGYLAAALWHLDEREDALRHIRKAVELSHSYSWAWERLGEWSEETGHESLSLEVARGIVTQEPGNVDGWLALAEQLGPCEESLQTLQRAIELEPRRIESHDRLMQHLVFMGRFDEARRVTDDPVWEGNVPVTLRVNIPWIRYRQGMVRDAIREMRQFLETEPRHAEAWRMLAVWAENAEDKDIWLEASRRYAQLLPTDAVAQNYLAGALEAHELNDEAIASYQRALQLAPDNKDSALSLFDLQLAAKQYEEAIQTLSLIHLHHPHGDAWIDAREIQLHCHHGEKEAALAKVRRLISRDANGKWPLDTTKTAMLQAGWSRELDNELSGAIHPGSTAHSSVGRAWINLLREQKRLRAARRRVKQLFLCGDAGIEAIDALLDAMIERSSPLEVQLFIWRHNRSLHHFTTTWSTVGYFYARQEWHRKVVRWMADWHQREKVPAWALNNLAIAHREVGQWEKSAEVCAYALQHEPGEYSHKFHLWLALEYGLRGNLTAMESEMEVIDIEEISAAHQYVYHLMLALHTGESLRSNSAEALDTIRAHLRNGLKVYPAYASDSTLRKLRQRVLKRITRAMGSFPFNLYYYWRLL